MHTGTFSHAAWRRRARRLAPSPTRMLALAAMLWLVAIDVRAAEPNANAQATPSTPHFTLSHAGLHAAPLHDSFNHYELSAALNADQSKVLAAAGSTLQAKLTSTSAGCTNSDTIFANNFEP